MTLTSCAWRRRESALEDWLADRGQEQAEDAGEVGTHLGFNREPAQLCAMRADCKHELEPCAPCSDSRVTCLLTRRALAHNACSATRGQARVGCGIARVHEHGECRQGRGDIAVPHREARAPRAESPSPLFHSGAVLTFTVIFFDVIRHRHPTPQGVGNRSRRLGILREKLICGHGQRIPRGAKYE